MNTSKTGSILIVDDDPEIVKAIGRALRRGPYDLRSTCDPREAAELIEQESFDVLISDIDMPQMSGLELVSRARAVRPQVVRILVTGAGTMELAVRAINEGEVHRFLSKPFDSRELRRTVEEAIERQRELRRASEAGRRAELRRQLFAHLESEHPGITVASWDEDGAYAVDPDRARASAAASGLDSLLS